MADSAEIEGFLAGYHARPRMSMRDWRRVIRALHVAREPVLARQVIEALADDPGGPPVEVFARLLEAAS